MPSALQAQPLGWWQMYALLMHESPQALPVLHTLQHEQASGVLAVVVVSVQETPVTWLAAVPALVKVAVAEQPL